MIEENYRVTKVTTAEFILYLLGAFLLVEIGVIIIPLFVFVPGLGALFPSGFGQYGWVYTIMGVIAFVPTLLVFFITSKIVDNWRKSER